MSPSPGSRLRERGRRVWRWFFPERMALPEEVRRAIRTVLPTLDLDRVAFYRGVPHLVRLVGSQAITLPDLLAPRRTGVYVDSDYWDTETVEGVGTLVHEAYHALQVQESGWGIGPLRPFLALYFACGAANRFRYKGHPMEEDAYRLAGRRRSLFESSFPGPAPDPAVVERCVHFAAPSAELRFWRKLAASTPLVKRFVTPETRRFWAIALLGFPPIGLWMLLWTAAASFVWLARLLVESAGVAVAGLLWGSGALLSAAEALPSLFRRAPGAPPSR